MIAETMGITISLEVSTEPGIWTRSTGIYIYEMNKLRKVKGIPKTEWKASHFTDEEEPKARVCFLLKAESRHS